MSYFEGKSKHEQGMNDLLNLLIVVIEGSGAQENALFYPPKKNFDLSNSPRKQVECSCEPLDGKNSIVELLHQFLCQNVQTTIS